MIFFRHADPRFGFLWETSEQPPGRWHAAGEGPAHYLADTPDGAWAELLRHEEIRDPQDLAGIRRALWAVEVPKLPETSVELPEEILFGGFDSHLACHREGARLRNTGAAGFLAVSAALLQAGARGWVVEDGLREGPARDGKVCVLFGRRADLVGWPVVFDGRPPEYLVSRVRHLEE